MKESTLYTLDFDPAAVEQSRVWTVKSSRGTAVALKRACEILSRTFLLLESLEQPLPGLLLCHEAQKSSSVGPNY